MYTSCPICGQKVSEKTVKLTGACNECDSKRRLNTYLKDSYYRVSKAKSEFTANLLIDFILFIKNSSWKYGQLNRMAIDFLKVLQGYEGKQPLIESDIVNDYFSKSSIKSPTAIYTIKVFLYSKNLIVFDEISNENSFYPEDIRPERRLNQDVLEYFYSENKCHDCGANLTEKSQHNYCYDCIAFRSIYNRSQFDYLNNTFTNESIKGLYINYVHYMFSLNRKVQTYADILSNSEKFFVFLQDYIPDGLQMYPFTVREHEQTQKYKLVHGNKYFNILLSEEWLYDFEKEFSSKNKFKDIFLFYLESLGILKQRPVDEKIKILQKVNQFESSLQQPILKLIEFESQKIENLNKKNASLTKSWTTIYKNIDEIKVFYYYLKKDYIVSSWAEVTEDMVNKYLLGMDFTNGQIRKRTLFNFFTFLKKHGFVFVVPIEQFVARDSMIEVAPLSLKQHKAIFKAIEYGSGNLVVERFLSSLVYFYGLTTSQIKSLELEDINLDVKCIYINGKPPAYLSDSDLILLKKVLTSREEMLGRKKSNKLFPAFKSIKDISISNQSICKKVKQVTRYSPKSLRIAAFQYCSAKFGSQYLQECFGLSLTQSARYARIGEELLELQVLDDIK
ncbi:hypothetical protein AM499_02735 [Bacillus sp. FJAT-22090]|uniref:site-specific integrase n=1 Tax=Bacillus sp. FJAT-22090 TaxID=1581038 RepID=UPI0006B02C85|nr:site-specific integrase [Bacillus sp. FJAT-22090]ALC84848.1 hypothetical protein AM499_02735 [Bacillus sp. FJAT-22090]